ncbi:hypothetical protein [Alkalicoccobacillus porphyridii]|nr:hypothetical protein [Alkalicoccobacillus porphyridii]
MKFYRNKEDGKTNRRKETYVEIPAHFIIAVAAVISSIISVLLNI